MAKMKARLETAQHILHHILTYDYNAKQAGMQFYENKIRLDVKCKQDLTKIPKEEFEERVNSVIKKNLLVTKKMYKREEVPKNVNISTVPEGIKEIRIVAIGDFDIQPCANPHVDDTSEIGKYKILEIKRVGKDTYRFVGAVMDTEEIPKQKLSQKERLQPPRGTRDFFPEEMILREKVFDTVKKIFRRWGFDPFKSPAFENYELFTMKESIGEAESDKLYIFEDKSGRKLSLRFDQSVPFARQVAGNPQLTKPIRRYEISRVWRYEEVKKGRYREFWQCDCDIVGIKNALVEAELIAVVLDILEELGFKNCYMRINNRKLLSGIMEYCGIKKEKIIDAYRSIDKLDKVGKEGVGKELEQKEISRESIDKIIKVMEIKGKPSEVLSKIKKLLMGKQIEEEIKLLEETVGYLKELGKENVVIDLSLARGLDYYTSTIFEAMSEDKSIGSLAGGGRYDKLIGTFAGSDKEIPVNGFGFGIERVIDLLKERGDKQQKTYTQIFVANVNDQVRKNCLKIAQKLRKSGINTQTDIMERNLGKQLEYVDSLGIPYTLIVGPEELKKRKFKLKNMKTREEKELTIEDIIKQLEK